MAYSTEFGLFQVLEQVLKEAEKPMTCNELFDDPRVKEYAKTANRVSDYLGGLFRRRRALAWVIPEDVNTILQTRRRLGDKAPEVYTRNDKIVTHEPA